MTNNNIVWDSHAGIFPTPDMDLNALDHWLDNNVDYLSINVGFDIMSKDETLKTLKAYRKWILANDDRFVLAGSIDDITTAKQTNRLAVAFDIEGTNALGGDISMVDSYHKLGVRQILFAYNLNNDASGGCHDKDIGLTPYGTKILAEINRVGMVVDASHASYKSSMDLINHSTTPVVFSHCNPASVWQHQRNITNEQMKACADNGGVIGLNGLGIFLGNNIIDTETLLKHLFYMIDLVGTDHVGIGFDYTPDVTIDLSAILSARPDYWPAGQQYDTKNIGHAGPKVIPALINGMQSRGMSKQDINGVIGENFMRVAKHTYG